MTLRTLALSSNTDAILGIVGMIFVLGLFAGAILLGAWIDGRRQKLRDAGLHPETTETLEIKALEERR